MGLMDFFKNLFGGKKEPSQEAAPESQETPAETVSEAETPSQNEQAQ